MAFAMERNTRCQLCGTASWEWEEDPRAYVPVQQICWGCYHKDNVRETGSDMAGVSVVLVTRDQATAAANVPTRRPRRADG